ncbi:putative glyoxalase superfamily protein PhnB [Paenibacillus amylolyticus]|uniref:Bleomycin resistance protein n=1 Tax=Paenibacillus amylolyticus TaxID=1451 RepID=A0AAP5H168_PAEAM|nr:glyoxalase superfamily protein [Paenibacillus amylolyticus]MDR6723086.1 putative glyoxalase superfamily protein PhnB [Paenibacillus amylolyticus]
MLKGIVPILRMFDENKAKEFYLDYLDFQLDWEHRFEPDMPLYMQISRDTIIIHLSEHHGDCTPGAALRVETDDVQALHQQLHLSKYTYARPGVEETPWHSREMTVTDPFGNRIIFAQTITE